MVYIVKSTEKNNEKASEYETKGMLYLMSEHEDANEMYFFVIDFFNDVTSVHRMGHRAWDLQSKGERNLTANKLGKYLVTLYKNYISDFNFSSYILFVAGISPAILENKDVDVFTIDNVKVSSRTRIFNSLKEEAFEKSYIENSKVDDKNILSFLSQVTFVVCNKEKHEYIKQIVENHSSLRVNDGFLAKIFDEIRDKQTIKKNIAVEEMKLLSLEDFEPTGKYITHDDILLLILSRLIHKDNIDNNGVPVCFVKFLNTLRKTDEEINELVESCQQDIKRMLFDKNNARNYWELFFDIYNIVNKNPSLSVVDIYNLLGPDRFLCTQYLNFNSAKYFIALIKDGIKK